MPPAIGSSHMIHSGISRLWKIGESVCEFFSQMATTNSKNKYVARRLITQQQQQIQTEYEYSFRQNTNTAV